MSLFQSMLWLSSCLVVNFCSQVALLFSSYPCLSTPAVHINEQKVLKPFSLSLYLPNPFFLFLSSLCLHCCSNIKILMHHRDGGDGMGAYEAKRITCHKWRFSFQSFVVCLLSHKPSCTWIMRNLSYLWLSAKHAALKTDPEVCKYILNS